MLNEVRHPNGFSGFLYGTSSMKIYGPNGFYLHTGSRNPEIKTDKDLYKHLEHMPEFVEAIKEDPTDA